MIIPCTTNYYDVIQTFRTAAFHEPCSHFDALASFGSGFGSQPFFMIAGSMHFTAECYIHYSSLLNVFLWSQQYSHFSLRVFCKCPLTFPPLSKMLNKSVFSHVSVHANTDCYPMDKGYYNLHGHTFRITKKICVACRLKIHLGKSNLTKWRELQGISMAPNITRSRTGSTIITCVYFTQVMRINSRRH